MSSTASIKSISSVRCSGRTGAKPTPQLPNRIVVTPCQEEGASTGSQVAPLRRPTLAPDLNDRLAVDRNTAGKGGRAGAVENGPAANDDVVHAGPSYLRCLHTMPAPKRPHNRPRRMAIMP